MTPAPITPNAGAVMLHFVVAGLLGLAVLLALFGALDEWRRRHHATPMNQNLIAVGTLLALFLAILVLSGLAKMTAF